MREYRPELGSTLAGRGALEGESTTRPTRRSDLRRPPSTAGAALAMVTVAALITSCSLLPGGDVDFEPDRSDADSGSQVSTEQLTTVSGPQDLVLTYAAGTFDDDVAPEMTLAPVVDDFAQAFAAVSPAGRDEAPTNVPTVTPTTSSNGSPDADPFEAPGDTSAFEPPDGQVSVVRITAPAQPRGEVDVSIPYDPAAVPEGAEPVVFYRDNDLDLWLPVPTDVDPAAGTLTATTTHFTDFMAGFKTVAGGGSRVADWMAYQVADFTGARVGPPTCEGTPPAWADEAVHRVDADAPLNTPLLVCTGSAPARDGGPDLLEVRVGVNRAFALDMTSTPSPTGHRLVPGAAVDEFIVSALTPILTTGAPATVLVPGTSTAVLTFEQPQADRIEIAGRVTARGLALTTVANATSLALAAAAEADEGRALPRVVQEEAYRSVADCALGVLDRGVADRDSPDGDRFAGQYGKVLAKCVDTATDVLDITFPGRLKERFLLGLQVGTTLGRGGQSAIDGAFDSVSAGTYGERPYVVTVPVNDPLPGGGSRGGGGGGVADGDLSGVWSGRAGGDQDYYDVEVTMTADADEPTGYSATIRYPNYRDTGTDLCGGTLEAQETRDGVLHYVERIEWESADICLRDGAVTLTPDGDSLLFAYVKNGSNITSTLVRGGGGDDATDRASGPVPLYDLPHDGGPGDSGQAATATVDGSTPPSSTVQWIGCGGGSRRHLTTYDLGGRYDTLTGQVALADHTPADFVGTVAVVAGGPEDVEEAYADSLWVVAGLTRDMTQPVDLGQVPVAGLDRITVVGHGTAGTCSSAGTGFAVLVDATVQ